MKKYLLVLFFLFSSCAIEGEVFRLQTRMNSWYKLLDDTEDLLFAQNDIQTLGASLDQKESQDPIFKSNIVEVRIDEAIMSFDGTQTAHFFYNILLRDLARFSYEELFDSLSTAQKIEFITTSNTSIPAKVFSNAKRHYGFDSFTDAQIVDYYRTVSFPANYYPVIYDILVFLARYHNMESFLQGDMNTTLTTFDRVKELINSRSIPHRRQGEKDWQTWNEFKSRTYLSSLSDEEFLRVLAVVLPQMDTDVRIMTINNIRNRFLEQQQ